MNKNKFLILKALINDYGFTAEDIEEYMSFSEEIGVDIPEDLQSMKKLLFSILSEVEHFAEKYKAKGKRKEELNVQLYKVTEAANKLSISEPEIRKLIKAGEIKTVNITGGPRGTRISLEEIKRLAA